MSPLRERTGRAPLTRAAIVAAGLRVAAQEGVEAVTMRRLATELDTGAMSLYRHVAGKRELVLLLLDEVVERLPPVPVTAAPDERLVAIFRTVHDHLRDYGWVVRVLAEGELSAARALRIVEDALEALDALGVASAEALHAYALLWHYTLGHLVSAHAGDAARRASRLALLRRAPMEDLPRTRAVLEAAVPYDAEEGFAFGLRALVRGLLPP